jgi:hypothetical protein
VWRRAIGQSGRGSMQRYASLVALLPVKAVL